MQEYRSERSVHVAQNKSLNSRMRLTGVLSAIALLHVAIVDCVARRLDQTVYLVVPVVLCR